MMNSLHGWLVFIADVMKTLNEPCISHVLHTQCDICGMHEYVNMDLDRFDIIFHFI